MEIEKQKVNLKVTAIFKKPTRHSQPCKKPGARFQFSLLKNNQGPEKRTYLKHFHGNADGNSCNCNQSQKLSN